MTSAPNDIIFTNKARCRDCYRCVRVCPVKAIRMHDGQAHVDTERCIACGTCVRECPQGAKSIRNDVQRAVRLLASGEPVACSVAPSFAAAFEPWQQRRLPSALRQLGFSYVGETAIGAYHSAAATARAVARDPNRRHVCTACPAVVRYVERYRPAQLSQLVPVVSPMMAHARHVHEQRGENWKVVFLGPCVAKKAEAERPELAGAVDCVLTFEELQQWLEQEGIDLRTCEESGFDEAPEGEARLFPLEGGCVRTAGWTTDVLDGHVLAVSGFNEVRDSLDSLTADAEPLIIEPLFCARGCIGGPAMPGEQTSYHRRGEVLKYAEHCPGCPPDTSQTHVLATRFTPSQADREEITEEQIRHVLEKTGKASEEDQLNCGACGYPTCREKAIAVIRGLAEVDMCMPYVRRLAEQRVDRIIETSPNGIVILDDQLRILSMNPAFRRMFMCSDAVCGRPVSYLLDPEPFERLAADPGQLIESTVEYPNYHLTCHQILYALADEQQYVGIFVNVTRAQTSERQLDELRVQTVLQARELLDQQTTMAETIAVCLGENAARSEALLDKLMLLAEGEKGATPQANKQWLRDTYTSK